MSSLDNLKVVAPDWVEILQDAGDKILCSAHAVKPSGLLGRKYQLEILSVLKDRIDVLEVSNDSILPKCCVERHINIDATFCLHWNSSKSIADTFEAQWWWQSLGSYLNNQDYATKRRNWPIHAQLSHGKAAATQIRMEQIANEYGWRDEILESIFRQNGWLAGKLPRLTKNKAGLVNSRSACPRGCRQLHGAFRKQSCERRSCDKACKKIHSPIVRVNCPQRSSVEGLLLLEYERRRREKDVISDIKKRNIKCCGTMDNCPLD